MSFCIREALNPRVPDRGFLPDIVIRHILAWIDEAMLRMEPVRSSGIIQISYHPIPQRRTGEFAVPQLQCAPTVQPGHGNGQQIHVSRIVRHGR